ncbi:MAG: hypothetical protein HONBIEJF_00082 [Fimbriimonadaceae bacterium]|nr:hypothetical protein [Fimbriimonadaceae bacterium]
MNILDTLNDRLSGNTLSEVAELAGVDPADGEFLLDKALPEVLPRLLDRATTPEGAREVMDASSGKIFGGDLENIAGLVAEGTSYSSTQAEVFIGALVSKVVGILKEEVPNLDSADGWVALTAEERGKKPHEVVEEVPRPTPASPMPIEAPRAPEGMGWLGWFLPLVLVGSTLAYGINQSSCAGPDPSPPAATGTAEAASSGH